MKKIIAIMLCTLLALSAFACSAKSIIDHLTEQAEEIGESFGELGENLGEIGSEIGENLGEIGSEIGENLGEIGSEIGENLGGMQIPNPFVDYQTLKEAEEAANFTLKVPAAEDFGEPIVQVMDGKMIQLIYLDSESNPQLYIRKQAGDEDISGDYNEYPEVSTETVGETTVTLKGGDGKVSTAIWSANGYSYAVMFETPVEKDAALALIGGVA